MAPWFRVAPIAVRDLHAWVYLLPGTDSRPELCARPPKNNARQTISSICSTWSCAAPGIQSQIEVFYDANATEDDWVCRRR